MSTRKNFLRASTIALSLILLGEPLVAQNRKPGGKSTSNSSQSSNNSGRSSRWGDHLNSMRQQNRSAVQSQSRSSQSRISSNRGSSQPTVRNRVASNPRSSTGSINRTARNSSGSSSFNRGNTGRPSVNNTRSSGSANLRSRGLGNTNSRLFSPNRSSGASNRVVTRNTPSGRQSNSGLVGSSRRSSASMGPTNRVDRDPRNSGSGLDRGNRTNDSSRANFNRVNRDRVDSRGTYRRAPGPNSNSRTHFSHSRNNNKDRNKHFGNKSSYHDRYYDRYDNYDYYDHKYYGSHARSFYSHRHLYPYRSRSSIYLGAGLGAYGHYVLGNTYDRVYSNSYSSAYSGSYDRSTGNYVVLFEHRDYRGEALEIHAGESVYNLREVRITNSKSFNDRFSSLQIHGDVTVVLYVDSEFRGERIYVYGSVIDFSRDRVLRDFNDKISSIEVIPGRVDASTHHPGAIYENAHQALSQSDPYASSQVPGPGYTDPSGEPRNSIATAAYSSPARVHCFDQPDFKGNRITFEPGSVEVDLSRRSKGLAGTWNDSIASIRIEGNAEVFLYTDADYYGRGIAVSESVNNLASQPDLTAFSGTISSIVVNPRR